MLPAAPALMLHLPGGSGISVAQQAAWALGEVTSCMGQHASTWLHFEYLRVRVDCGARFLQWRKDIDMCTSPGNLAGDSADFRARLVANGVLAPLAKLATAPVAPGAVPGGPDLAAAGTAAWALSNVVKGAGAEVIPQRLVRLCGL